MGIRGLTTFINNRAHLYLQDYELHHTNVVIDGNGVASHLYKWHCRSNDCFGGDYDKFAAVIHGFFNMLAQCSIIPYVILDGGYEKRKLNTVLSRMRNKVIAAEGLNAVTEGSESVFPLFLREVFVDIVLSLGVKVARCDFEGDMEVAGIARALDCPVISYDSDFYIFGCLYIPFSTIELVVKRGKDATRTAYSYLPCKIYRVENFLQAFGGLDKNNLPLLAVLLGNDYIKRSLFTPFFRNLKIQKCSGVVSDQQKRIKSVIVWLQNEENIEEAIKKVLSRFKDGRRKVVLRKIQEAMKCYYEMNCELLNYLGINKGPISCVDVNFDKLEAAEYNEDDISDTGASNDDSEIEANKDVELEDVLNKDTPNPSSFLSEIFKKNYRNCQYPASFMDMVTMSRYYCVPQVEVSSFKHSHTISLDILNIIFKILTPECEKRLKIVYRAGKIRVHFTALNRPNVFVPSLEQIQKYNQEERQLLLLELLSIDKKFFEVFNSFPVEWHLLLISLKYYIEKTSIDKALIYSCLMCFIILQYIDKKIGFHRVSKTFDKKFTEKLEKAKTNNQFTNFEAFSFDDCLVFMNKMISSFQMDAKLKGNYRLYDKTLVHSTSELQSVLLHVKYLNSLLNNPFPILEIHQIFDGTFIYNMTINLRKRTDIIDYLTLFLKECPCMLECIKNVISKVEDDFDCGTYLVGNIKKPRKKKKKKSVTLEHIDMDKDEDLEADIDGLVDPNNPYSILAVL
ncbi:protein asteroid-like [Anthonomus grandis grandis]|uniref:protein asteroid-like n=1 Tax=Anthonomus grandis grandis TaxID=2921223 RepID=UPI0021655075|nr:protein asteroid-like [Anthonomus grandis grandis]